MDGGVPQTGSLVGGAYRIAGKLGEGSMGVVLLAHDEQLDRPVALKVTRRSLIDADFLSRFHDEALAMARVSHPNVVQIHALGEHESVPYFVMEYVEGSTLETWRPDGKPADIGVALRILEQTCQGLAAIHAANTLHRDIKPSNILLDRTLRPKIADLGLARRSSMIDTGDTHIESTEVAGTPAFMAPEIAYQRVVDPALAPRADIYSLGCVAYELLTGRAPFDAPNGLVMMVRHASGKVTPPSELREELGPDIDRALMRALAKNPVDRTPSAEAFCLDLMACRDRSREPTRILVADDNDDFRYLMEHQLNREFPGAEIVVVADGVSALAAFDERTPSIVIMDLQMPGLDGTELTALIRARDKSARVPILVLTASGTPSDWHRLSALGADRFLVKPVVIEDVVTLVRRSLRERAQATRGTALGVVET